MFQRPVNAIIGSYNLPLVVLSVIIAIFASSVAFTLAGRIRWAPADQRKRWLLAGAGAMGTGIWMMHFTGMLAYDLSMPVEYDLPTVAVSLLAAIGAAAVALNVIYRRGISWTRLVLGGVFMGAGIGVMHYSGMYAMRLHAHTRYDLRYVLLSVVVAVAVAILALWFAAQSMDEDFVSAGDMVSGALLMGLGIASMHYTAMVASSFQATNQMVGSTAYSTPLPKVWLGAILVVTLLILGAATRIGRKEAADPASAAQAAG